MHDIVDLETRGVPGVFVASQPFVDAAVAQGARLGLDAARVIVEHPIQDRTAEEMTSIADAAVDELVAAITGPWGRVRCGRGAARASRPAR